MEFVTGENYFTSTPLPGEIYTGPRKWGKAVINTGAKLRFLNTVNGKHLFSHGDTETIRVDSEFATSDNFYQKSAL